nr:MAG TPA: hypothetical protein [Caudoviricetes sp.]
MGERLQKCSRFFHVVCLLRLGGFSHGPPIEDDKRRERGTCC